MEEGERRRKRMTRGARRESGGRSGPFPSCPSRCRRQIIVLTLSELLRPPPPRSSTDYSLEDGLVIFSLSTERARARAHTTDGLPTPDDDARPDLLERNSGEYEKGEGERAGKGKGARACVCAFEVYGLLV